MSLRQTLVDALVLVKARIALSVGLSAASGYLLYSGRADANLLLLVLGTVLLASSAAVINELEEAEADCRMPRTRNRPIPSGRVSTKEALLLAGSLGLLGALVLFHIEFVTLGLGLFALAWYDLVYTSVKRCSAFSVLPGAMVGAVPPLMGWTAAGGDVFDARALVLSVFFFLWQVPHTWLLMLEYEADYSQAGFPTPMQVLTRSQLRRISFVWMALASITVAIFPLYGIVHQAGAWLLLAAAGLGLTVLGMRFSQAEALSPKRMFSFVNLFAFLVAAVIVANNF